MRQGTTMLTLSGGEEGSMWTVDGAASPSLPPPGSAAALAYVEQRTERSQRRVHERATRSGPGQESRREAAACRGRRTWTTTCSATSMASASPPPPSSAMTAPSGPSPTPSRRSVNRVAAIMNDFNEPGSLAPTGLYLGGSKYMVIQGEPGAVIRGKKGPGGVTIKKTNMAIIIGIYEEPMTPGQCNMVVERLGDYLVDQGF
uniref:Profilin n=1 Tax=Setaria viridis TaxID=4556 RepID=A0A4U6UIB1_SETVI|nr:uncharacterized protein LOC117855288 isoform X1 [Setaria viridis]XP_034593489.1 uncharacterized protein LOC117855288 isoform X1 [Setaria viridis]TKW13933.1 hypothetical protein SEVIR_5G133400v2 [Setaria viridis]